MKKSRILIPKPSSSFLLVQCNSCGDQRIIFSATTKEIRCKVCDGLIAKPTGGKAEITGAVLRRLD